MKNILIVYLLVSIISFPYCRKKQSAEEEGLGRATTDISDIKTASPYLEVGHKPKIELFQVNGAIDKHFCPPIKDLKLEQCDVDTPIIRSFQLSEDKTITIDGNPSDWTKDFLVTKDQPYDVIIDTVLSDQQLESFDLTAFYIALNEDSVYIMLQTVRNDRPNVGEFQITLGTYAKGNITTNPNRLGFFIPYSSEEKDLLYFYDGQDLASGPITLDNNEGNTEIVIGDVVEVRIARSFFDQFTELKDLLWSDKEYFVLIETFVNNDGTFIKYDNSLSALNLPINAYKCDVDFNNTEKSNTTTTNIAIITSFNDSDQKEMELASHIHQNSKTALNYILEHTKRDITFTHDLIQHLVTTDQYTGINRGTLGIEFNIEKMDKFRLRENYLFNSTIVHEYAHYLNKDFTFKWLIEAHSQLLQMDYIREYYGTARAQSHHNKLISNFLDAAMQGTSIPLELWDNDHTYSFEEELYLYGKSYFFSYFLNNYFATKDIIYKLISENISLDPNITTTDQLITFLSEEYEITDLSPYFDGWVNQESYLTSFGIELASDQDNDGLSNFDEEVLQTNPDFADSDQDLIADEWELNHCLNPLAKDHIIPMANENVNNNNNSNSNNNDNGIEDNEEESFGLLMDGFIGDWNHYIGVEIFLEDNNNDLEAGCPQITNIEYTYAVIDDDNFCGLVVTKLDEVLPDTTTSYQFSLYLIPYNPEGKESKDYFELTYLFPNDYYGVYKNNREKTSEEKSDNENAGEEESDNENAGEKESNNENSDEEESDNESANNEESNGKIVEYYAHYVNYNEIELCVPLQTLYSNSTEFNPLGYFLFEAFTFFNETPNEDTWINCDKSDTSFPRSIGNQ